MEKQLYVSVVINTYNRAKSLKVTLESLYHQTDRNFEVIVVNGPSSDETEEVVAVYGEKIKLISCPVRNLSVSRNMGIEAAAGDIVAFIDDDAIADTNWIHDLIAGYDDIDVGGVGGLVYDHTGMQLQYRYSACDRKGDTDFSILPPFEKYCIPGGEKFLYLQGTNCSFRKGCLEEIGGFDEEFEYYLDEVDVCMRIIDLGYKIKPLDNAIVHHKYMKSFLRNEAKVVLHPYSTVKNKYYFAIKNNKKNDLNKTKMALAHWTDEVKAGGNWNLLNDKMTKEELDIYLEEVEQACKDGELRGMGEDKTRKIQSQKKRNFLPFQIIERNEKPLKICYLSKEYPPINFGGIGRYTYDLATTFAAKGHEVHVITEGSEQDTVDFESGVWVHRLVNRLYESFDDMVLGWNLSLQARNYFELERINKQSPIDIVNGPIWLCETGMANCSRRYPTVLTLMTTQKILNNLTQMPVKGSHPYKLMELEENDICQHKNIHAISNSILNNCRGAMKDDVNAFIAPLGCRDLSGDYIAKKDPQKIIVFYIGRLEHRKGTDLLLKAAENILSEKRYNNVEFIIAGKDTTNTLSGSSFKEEFIKRNEDNENVLQHVKFLGEIAEDELMQNYANADIACTPSRYESFGIVLLEGMSFSNAIIAANVGGMKDIVKDGATGLFFEPDDDQDLTVKLKKLLDNPEFCRECAEKARKEYLEVYSLDAVYKRLYEEYSKIINNFVPDLNNSFDQKQYAEMIANAEDIKIEVAEKRVNDLLEKHKTVEIPTVVLEEANLSNKLKIMRKIYRLFKKIFPKTAMKMRNKWLRQYYQNQNRGMKGLVIQIYHFLIGLPFLGIAIRYLVNLILLPLRMETTAHISVQLLNNDELLKQIGDMENVTRNIIYQIGSEIDYLRKKINNQDQQTEKIGHIISRIDFLEDTMKQFIADEEVKWLGEKKLLDEIKQFGEKKLLDEIKQFGERKQLEEIKQFEEIKQYHFEEMDKFANFLGELYKVADLIHDGQKENHYVVEDYSNRVVDRINQRLTDVRSELLFEMLRNMQIEQIEKRTIESKVLNRAKVEKARKDQNVRLNIGAGHICFNEYINVDEREINNIDIVADARNLPFEDNSIDEIYASHLIEHFTKNELESIVLPSWFKMLKEGGLIRVILPDLESMIKHYKENDYNINDLREVLYGLQEYPGDIHYALYGQSELQEIFEKLGMHTEYKFTGRRNGKCYDMELRAVKHNKIPSAD